MSILESILGNKTLVNAALGQLKNIIKKEGLEWIVIAVDPETDEIVLNMYKPGECSFIIKETDPQAAIEEIKPAIEQLQNHIDANDQNSPE